MRSHLAFDSFRDLIAAIGVRRLSAGLQLKNASHVRAMKTRNRIAPEYWDDVVEIARKRRIKGVSHELLAKLAAKNRRPRPQPATHAVPR